MANRRTCVCEGLEGRQLLANATFVIDRASSPVTISGSANGAALVANGTVDGFFQGQSAFSYTRRGIRFNDGIDGTIAIADSSGLGSQTYAFTSPAGSVSFSSPIFALNTSRVNVASKKFNVRRMDVQIVGGTLLSSAGTVDFATAITDLTVSYDVGHAKRTGAGLNAVKVTIPLDMDVTQTVTILGVPTTLVVNLSGMIVGTAQVFASGAEVTPQAAPASDDDDASRVADDVLG
jgi:hypothetical protein